MLNQLSVRLAPYDHALGGLAAANALVVKLLLLERDAARAYAGKLLDLVLARLVSAPHSLDKAVAVIFKHGLYLINRSAAIGFGA